MSLSVRSRARYVSIMALFASSYRFVMNHSGVEPNFGIGVSEYSRKAGYTYTVTAACLAASRMPYPTETSRPASSYWLMSEVRSKEPTD